MGVADLTRWWGRGLVDPRAAMLALPASGRPTVGLAAVVTRFAIQDLVETLPLALLHRRPFTPARLPVRPERHYRAQLVFLPVLGVGEWLVMGCVAHRVLRVAGARSDLSRVLDVLGAGMLLPMPVLWTCDVTLIATNRFRLPELAFVNPAALLWQTALCGLGLRTVLDVPWRQALAAALAANLAYVLPSSQFVR